MALFFKPKKLKEPWIHKQGFSIDYDIKSAFNNIEFQKNKYSWQTFHPDDFFKQLDEDVLIRNARDILYQIESSSNNYIEAICSIGGVCLLYYLFILGMEIWNYPNISTVRIFMILVLISITMVIIYIMKKSSDKRNIKNYLSIEDALYFKEFGKSKYK